MFNLDGIFGDQPAALALGAALLAIFQTAKFADIDVRDRVTSRYVSFLPGAKAKDFTGRGTYRISLVTFVAVTWVLYYLVTLISPTILDGAILQFTGQKADLKGVPYPIYISALFMGLTQPVLPGFTRIGDGLRSFFHERIEVPKRVVEISESLTAAIQARGGSQKATLVKEVKHLIDDDWLARLDTSGDLPFYRLQLTELELGDPTTAAQTLHGASVKELRDYIEKLVLFNLIAVIRKSGPRRLSDVAEWSHTKLAIPSPGLLNFLARLALSGFAFGMMLLGVWLILKSAGPVIATHLQAGPMSLWPNDEWLGVELARIVPAIFVCLLICVSMLPPAEPTDHRRKGSTIAASNGGDLIEFAHKSVLILATCFAVSLLIFSVAELYQYGIATIVSGGISFAKIAIVFARTAPSVVLSYWVLLFLAREQAGQRMPFALMAAILAGTVALAAFLVALFFLQVDFLPQFREYSGGWDYVVFYVSANVLVAECAFVTMALFFRSSINGHETMKSLALLRRNASHA